MKKILSEKSTELFNSELNLNSHHLSLTSLSWKNVIPHQAWEVYKSGTTWIVPPKREHF